MNQIDLARWIHLFAGRLVCATELTCLLPNLLNFVLRPQTGELYIVEGAAFHDTPVRAGAALGSGTSMITNTPGPSVAVLYIEINLPPAASVCFLAAS